MKRIIGIIFVLLLLINVSFAEPSKTKINVDGNEIITNKVQVLLDGAVMLFDVPPVIYNERTMVPLRFIVETLGGKVTWNEDLKRARINYKEDELDIFIDQNQIYYNGQMKEMPYNVPAKLMGINSNGNLVQRTMVPLRFVSEFMDCSVDWNGDRFEASIKNKKSSLEDTSNTVKDENMGSFLSVCGDGKDYCLNLNVSESQSYNDFILVEPDRIVLDLFDYQLNEMPVGFYNDNNIFKKDLSLDFAKAIRIYSDQIEEKTRFILDLNYQTPYRIEKTQNGIRIRMIGVLKGQSEVIKTEEIEVSGDLKTIRSLNDGNQDYLEIEAKNRVDYHLMKLDNPDRLVIDLMDLKLPEGVREFPIQNSFVDGIRTSQFNPSGHYSENVYVLRVVLDLNASDTNIKVIQDGNILRIYNGDIAPNSNDSQENTQEENQAKPLDKAYVWQKSDDKLNIGLLYNSNINDISYNEEIRELIIGINNPPLNIEEIASFEKDDLLEAGYISKISSKWYYKFKFKKPIIYNYDGNGSSLLLNITPKKVEITGKKVLIDAGHGGTDPGAISPYSGVFEKDLTIKVAEYLKVYLDNMGYETVMIRKNDNSINKYERAELANEIGGDLFISIHFNALPQKSMKGIMTLYCPSYESEVKEEYHQYTLSKIIHEQLLGQLGVNDLKIRQRSGVVVLRETKMIAALAELGCLTNKEDEIMVRKDSYHQKAARALADAIDEYFKYKEVNPEG